MNNEGWRARQEEGDIKRKSERKGNLRNGDNGRQLELLVGKAGLSNDSYE